MAKQTTTTKSQATTLNFNDSDLRDTMQDFLQEEKKTGDGVINFATISGFAMLFVALTFVLQLIGLNIGPDLTNLVEVLPLIGGVLVTLVGFGYFVGDRKKEEEEVKKKFRKQVKKASPASYNSGIDVHGSEVSPSSRPVSASGLSNDLDGFEQFAPKTKSSSSFKSRASVDSYMYPTKKRLYKSRTDKKLAGVCGGLAKYFGMSSTAVRLLLVLSTLMWGTSLLIYFGLAIAMPKEPLELMDDFDF